MALNYHIGLFTADQNLNGDTPRYTRQNPNGNRRGYEVPEERDYYPYWGPSPFIDIAIMVSDNVTEKKMKEYVNSTDHSEKGNLAFVFFYFPLWAEKAILTWRLGTKTKKEGFLSRLVLLRASSRVLDLLEDLMKYKRDW